MAAAPVTYVFPPALLPMLRERFVRHAACLSEADDATLVRLLTTVFFAGLETYEGTHNPIRVVFVGHNRPEMVVGETSDATPLYRWKVLRFEKARPFVVPELVKLAAAGADERIYTAVGLLDGELATLGLAREGFSPDADAFVKFIAPRPGCLSVRNGREHRLEYDRGSILPGLEDVVFTALPVRSALEAAARLAGVEENGLADYLETVRSLVGAMTEHGRGGILIISPDEQPAVAESAPYRMTRDASLAALIRLSRRIETPESGGFARLLRNALVTEAERVVEEIGGLSGIDGATLLNRNLALVAFGLVLPTSGEPEIIDVTEPTQPRPTSFADRGTRHRASAVYAAENPGSIVIVASEDGQVSCLLREESRAPLRLWQLGARDARTRPYVR
jgi:hypothetical protein